MKIINKRDEFGNVIYDSKIAINIVDCALSEVKGVIKYPPQSKQAKESIKIEFIGDDLYIDVYVKVLSTVKVSETAGELQSAIKNALENTYGFRVADVNVHVIDVEFENN